MSRGAYTDLTAHMSKLEILGGIDALVAWDQQTMMPRGGAATKGVQAAFLAGLGHELATDPRIGEWLSALERTDLTEVQTAAVRNIGRSYRRATRVPADLVTALAKAQADGFQAWVTAKEAADYASFAPHLREVLHLNREKAAAIDGSRPAYDVHLDAYDPGTTSADLKPMFARLQGGLVELLGALKGGTDPQPLNVNLPVEKQRVLFREVVETMGYDFVRGRMDEAEHPFTITIGGPRDVRITIHTYEDQMLDGLSGAVHEAGHGMYEQGLPQGMEGTLVSAAASMGLHESQSRFWENTIGRSLDFHRWFSGVLERHFPGVGLSPEQLYGAANRVEPGLIRVSADEVTYNLHVIVRFEIELALFEGGLEVEDLPTAWNEAYTRTLGLTPTNDGVGVLQDVHWSSGAFGYFPSYTLGNLYAASLGAALREQDPGALVGVAQGDFSGVLAWLRTNIHEKGHLSDAPDRVRSVVGDRDAVTDLLDYLWGRHGALAGVSR
jgi:carboxypeptidase Taq